MNVLTLAEIMDRSMDILRKYIKTIIMFVLGYGIIMFIALIPIIIILAIVIGVFAVGGISPVIPIIVLISLSVLLFSGIFLSYNIGLINIAAQDILNEKIMAYDAIKKSFRSFFKVIGIAIAVIILSLPVLAVLGIIIYFVFNTFIFSPYLLVGVIDSRVHALSAVALFLIVSLVLVFVVLAYINFFFFSLHALTLEKRGVFGSIKRSFLIVKKSFWKILGSTILFYASVYFIRFSLQSFVLLVGGLIIALLKFLNVTQDITAIFVQLYTYSSYPVSIISLLVISPLWTIMMTLLYYNRRFINEGYDMTLKLEEIRKTGLNNEN